MATWTNSQPAPWLLQWPVRRPAMRWPMLLKRPSFLMSRWIISAGLPALVAWVWLLRLEAGEQAEATMFKNARDAGSGDAELSRDVLLGAALTAQSLDVIGCSEADLARQ